MRLFRLCLLVFVSVMLASCTGGRNSIKTVNVSYSDTTKYAIINMDLDFPEGNSSVEKAIREYLIDILDADIQNYSDNFEEISMDVYKGDREDLLSLVDYYGKSLSTFANFLSKMDDNDRRQSMLESGDYDIAEIDQMLESGFTWAYDISIKEIDQTKKYIVFSSCDYIYMGGAHGGVSGLGTGTFSKKDGKLITSFLKPGSEHVLQDAIRKGLLEYLNEGEEGITEDELMDYLFIDSDQPIPLPEYLPYPSEDGLVFVYQQYEIAAYALGMPSFVIPYDVVKPYLTDEAKEILF